MFNYTVYKLTSVISTGAAGGTEKSHSLVVALLEISPLASLGRNDKEVRVKTPPLIPPLPIAGSELRAVRGAGGRCEGVY